MLFAVFNGHGDRGKTSSVYARDHWAEYLRAKVRNIIQENETNDEDMFRESIEYATEKVHQEMSSNTIFNAEQSGTTLNSILIFGNQMLTCNLGDSRAIIISSVDRTHGAIGLFNVK